MKKLTKEQVIELARVNAQVLWVPLTFKQVKTLRWLAFNEARAMNASFNSWREMGGPEDALYRLSRDLELAMSRHLGAKAPTRHALVRQKRTSRK